MTQTPDWAERTEQAVLDAAIARAPALGWNARLVREACEACGLSLGDQELLLPQVRLVDQLNDAGELGKQWLSYPSLTDLRTSISHWLVMTTPATLQFDSEVLGVLLPGRRRGRGRHPLYADEIHLYRQPEISGIIYLA